MAYLKIVKAVDYDKLTDTQRDRLTKLLQDRKAELEKALSDVEEGLSLLGPKGRKSPKRKVAKKTAKRR